MLFCLLWISRDSKVNSWKKAQPIRRDTIRIVDILKDNWDCFLGEKGDKILEEMKTSIYEAVGKAIRCGDPGYGYALCGIYLHQLQRKRKEEGGIYL